MPPILEVAILVKKGGDFEAVRGVSFSVEQSEVFGLLGPNGAGKTTIVSVLTSLFPPTSGTARISFLSEREIAIASLEILEPNLESAFLHMTGKKLRE